MNRFYITSKIEGDSLTINDNNQLHHIKDVLRLKVNDKVTVFDNTGNEYLCSVAELGNKQVILGVRDKKPAKRTRTRLTVACAIPKKAKMDEIIDKLTQLGVDIIIPLETERVLVRMDTETKKARLKRWQKIAQSAAEQSQRATVPLVEAIETMKEVLVLSRNFNLKLIATLSGERKHVRKVISEAKPGSILILIGPEGDFTRGEVELATNVGFVPVSLGDYVLRVDTAAISLVSYIKLSLDE
jgi:16S rRNA (uracil1498-N3)-methyltransferase